MQGKESLANSELSDQHRCADEGERAALQAEALLSCADYEQAVTKFGEAAELFTLAGEMELAREASKAKVDAFVAAAEQSWYADQQLNVNHDGEIPPAEGTKRGGAALPPVASSAAPPFASRSAPSTARSDSTAPASVASSNGWVQPSPVPVEQRTGASSIPSQVQPRRQENPDSWQHPLGAPEQSWGSP